MLLYSAEVRWFVEGALPAGMTDWFRQGALPPALDARDDDYLVLGDCATVGVKIRGAGQNDGPSFEVKALRTNPRPMTISERAAGSMDSWVKWSIGGAEVLPFGEAVRQTAQLVTVTKRRALRRFSLAGDRPDEVGAEVSPSVGCGFELAEVALASRHWWTLALEASGPPGTVEDGVRQTAAHIFNNRPPPLDLRPESSLSYPAWLASRVSLVSA